MAEADELLAEIEDLGRKLNRARVAVSQRFIGQERVVDLSLTALICGGHGLLVGLPGLGKTMLVDTLATQAILAGTKGTRICTDIDEVSFH